MTDFKNLITTLVKNKVEFVIVGGVAATIHGSARLTQDLDVVYRRTGENYQKLVSALGNYQPYMRGAPPNLPFHWDLQTLEQGLNFTLTTALGDLDLLGEIAGGGSYENLLPHSVAVELFGYEVKCLGLERLIFVKKAAGRPKDLEAVAELEAIREETES